MPAPIERFVTDTGISIPAITTDQMREVDRIAVEETGPNIFQMMENAGRNLTLQSIEALGDRWLDAEIVVLAGTGGNGGGGICAARHLANRQGRVTVVLSNRAKLSEVTRFQHHVYQASPGRELELNELAQVSADLIVDAVIGYSLSGAPTDAAGEMIDWANASPAPVLALDVPSGIDSSTGETFGTAIQPEWTMTLALPKTGLIPERTGALYLADIGVPMTVYAKMGLEFVTPFNHRFRVPLTPE